MRNIVKNAVLDVYILLKSALKMQEIQFQSPQNWDIFRKGMLPDRHIIFVADYVAIRCPAFGNFNYVARPPLGNDNVTDAFVPANISNGY